MSSAALRPKIFLVFEGIGAGRLFRSLFMETMDAEEDRCR